MISSELLKAIENGKTVNQVLAEAAFNPDIHHDQLLTKHLNDYANSQKIQEPFIKAKEQYEAQVDLLKKATHSVTDFLSYPGDFIAASPLEYDKFNSDDNTDLYFFVARDEELDDKADELNTEFAENDFNAEVSKYIIYVTLVLNKNTSPEKYKKEIDELYKTGKLVKSYIKQLQSNEYSDVLDILFDWDL